MATARAVGLTPQLPIPFRVEMAGVFFQAGFTYLSKPVPSTSYALVQTM